MRMYCTDVLSSSFRRVSVSLPMHSLSALSICVMSALSSKKKYSGGRSRNTSITPESSSRSNPKAGTALLQYELLVAAETPTRAVSSPSDEGETSFDLYGANPRVTECFNVIAEGGGSGAGFSHDNGRVKVVEGASEDEGSTVSVEEIDKVGEQDDGNEEEEEEE